MTREVTDQLYIELDYYYPEEYYTYIAEAVSAVSAESSLSCDAGIILQAQATLSVSASSNIDAVKTVEAICEFGTLFTAAISISITVSPGADLNNIVNCSVTANYIAENQIIAASVFNIGCDAVKTIFADSTESAATTINIDYLRIRNNQAAHAAAFSLTAIAEIQAVGAAGITSSTTVTADAILIAENIIAVNSTANISADGDLIANGIATINSNFSVTIDYLRLRDNSISCASTATVAASISKFTGYSSDLTSAANLSATALRIQPGIINANSNFTVVCDAIRPEFFSANLSSAFTLAALKLYWIVTLSDADNSNTINALGTAVDNLKNVYTVATDFTLDTSYLIKFNKGGNVVWQNQLNHADAANVIDIKYYDGNTYVLQPSIITKFDLDGVIVWQKSLSNITASCLAISSSGIIAIAGDNKLITISTSGTKLSEITAQPSGTGPGAITPNFLALTYNRDDEIIGTGSTGNYFFIYAENPAISAYDFKWFTISASGGGVGGTLGTITDITTDRDRNIYLTTELNVFKFSPLRNILFRRYYFASGFSTGDAIRNIIIDDFDQVITTVRQEIVGTPTISRTEIYYANQIATIRYQSYLDHDDLNQGITIPLNSTVDDDRNLYISGAYVSTGSRDLFVTKLPPDAQGRDVYDDWNYLQLNSNDITGSNLYPTVPYITTDQSTTTNIIISNAANSWTSSSLTGTFTPIYLTGIDVIVNISDMQSISSLICDTAVLKPFTVNLQAQAFELTAAVKTGRTPVDIAVTATISAQTNITAVSSAALNSASTLNCDAVKIVSAQSSLNTEFSIASLNQFLRLADSQLISSCALSADAVKIANAMANINSAMAFNILAYISIQGQVSCDVVSTLSITVYEFTKAQANINAVYSVSADVIANKTGNSILISTASVTANVDRIRNFTINLSALNAILAIGTRLIIDPYYGLKVPADTRTWKVTLEDRLLVVDSENRVNTVQAEEIIFTVDSETRIWHIPHSKQVGARRVK